jgi:hypothetical protein
VTKRTWCFGVPPSDFSTTFPNDADNENENKTLHHALLSHKGIDRGVHTHADKTTVMVAMKSNNIKEVEEW